MTDPGGVTTYTYDPQTDRLVSKQTPFGTIAYTYDAAGDVTQIASSNASGSVVAYQYDKLNRLSTVTVPGQSPTNYSYDAVGNLAGYTYPNGVTTALQYDGLNRLTALASQGPQGAAASYSYTLGLAGNRTGVTELGGRTVSYGYDNLYRLTSETIANSTFNGTVGYTYDAVGNRKQITSTLAAIPSSGLLNYDANDRTLTDQYDNNGNTISQAGIADSYDFENHLTQHGYIVYQYDGDGNRVAKTIGGVTTSYSVDTLNPTGYAQVLDEVQSGAVTRSYAWGLQLVSETQLVAAIPPASPWQTSWYGYDGHGSVRYLTDASGAVTDTYTYDAFGNLINSTGSTANNYLFAGEQYDPDLGLYYNRARYLDVRVGRFWGMDNHEGDDDDPATLHKYAYTGDDPTDRTDHSGNDFDIGTALFVAAVAVTVMVFAIPQATQYMRGGSAEPRVATTQSESGEEFLKCHEGVNCEAALRVYDKDGSRSGNCTIGWGHKIHDGPCTDQDHSNYASFDEDAAEQLLFVDVQTKALAPIKRYVTVGLAQRELDALIDFTFNVGGGSRTNHRHPGLAGSQLLISLNAGNYPKAGTGFLGFMAGGSGIAKRRNDEKNLWDTGVYKSYGHVIP
jgi:RHS repeat-associated protein